MRATSFPLLTACSAEGFWPRTRRREAPATLHRVAQSEQSRRQTRTCQPRPCIRKLALVPSGWDDQGPKNPVAATTVGSGFSSTCIRGAEIFSGSATNTNHRWPSCQPAKDRSGRPIFPATAPLPAACRDPSPCTCHRLSTARQVTRCFIVFFLTSLTGVS